MKATRRIDVRRVELPLTSCSRTGNPADNQDNKSSMSRISYLRA
jgi:hypothetical protein